jgi:hypothetical protein
MTASFILKHFLLTIGSIRAGPSEANQHLAASSQTN